MANDTINCNRCEKITTNNMRPEVGDIALVTDLPAYGGICGECQTKRAKSLIKIYSPTTGIFLSCIAMDVPFIPSAMPQNISSNKNIWLDYIAKCVDDHNDHFAGRIFIDGNTDLYKIYGSKMSQEALRTASRAEISKEEKYRELPGEPGTTEQKEKWGRGPGKGYTDEEYETLDKHYKAYVSDRGGEEQLSEIQKLTLTQCCKWTMQAHKLAEGGEVSKAKNLRDMISAQLGDDQMRKKDQLPIENMRIDDLALALERAGLLRKGKIKGLREVQDALLRRLGAVGGKPARKFPYTLDAADHCIERIINTMRTNQGQGEILEFPLDEGIPEDMEGEFSPTQSEGEKKTYEALGIVRRR